MNRKYAKNMQGKVRERLVCIKRSQGINENRLRPFLRTVVQKFNVFLNLCIEKSLILLIGLFF